MMLDERVRRVERILDEVRKSLELSDAWTDADRYAAISLIQSELTLRMEGKDIFMGSRLADAVELNKL